LGVEPETRHFPDGQPVCSVSIATTDRYKKRYTGEVAENTEWHRVVFYRGLAEVAAQYLHKGASIYVEGKLRTRKWADRDGVDRYTTEILASNMQILDKKRSEADQGGNGASPKSDASKPAPHAAPGAEDMDDDIPF
jgi:single-strand DNA-binding protein